MTAYCLSHRQFESKLIFWCQIDFYTFMAYADIQAMNYLLSAISTTIQVIKLMDISIDYWICLFPTAILNNTAMHDKLYLFYSNKLYCIFEKVINVQMLKDWILYE
jgi:hypothetical protein